MSDRLWNSAERVSGNLFPEESRGGRSALVRDALAAATGDWMYSPYVAEQMQEFVFFNSRGDSFFSSREHLRFNSKVDELPCVVDQKFEKQKYYHDECPLDEIFRNDRRTWLLNRWIFNSFSAIDRSTGLIIDEMTDTEGVSRKSARLRVAREEGTFLMREKIAGLRDYVQWLDSDSRTRGDRAAFSIDFPVKHFSLLAVVDEALYAHRVPAERRIPEPRLEIRNREAVAFDPEKLREYLNLGDEMLKYDYGLCAMSIADRDIFQVARKEILSLRDRIELSAQNLSLKVDLDEIRSMLSVPRRFYYFRLSWTRPRTGLQVCVRFEKPDRIREKGIAQTSGI